MYPVILAAGKGSRMESDLPKPLLPVAGVSMVEHVLNTLLVMPDISPKPCVVVGYREDVMRDSLAKRRVEFASQEEQLGTGHAVRCALPVIPKEEENVVILYGDVPLISSATLNSMITLHQSRPSLTLLTMKQDDPAGYGRILRDHYGEVCGIVEEKDANDNERRIQEVNTGIMIVNHALLKSWIDALRADNAQKEYYLTDIVALANSDRYPVNAYQTLDPQEVMGANTPAQLAELETAFFARQ